MHSIRVSGVRHPQAGGASRFGNSPTTWGIVLEEAGIGADGFTGETRVTSASSEFGIVDTGGGWGGKLSNMPDGDGNPRLVAGTHGARFTSAGGTEGSFVGVFAGTTDE